MDSRMLRILAGLLAIGSVALSYVGYQLSQKQATDQTAKSGALPAQTGDKQPVVIAQKAIPVGHVIGADDVGWVPFPVRPEHSYRSPTDVIGKTPAVPIAAGETLQERHFLPGSLLSRSVAPGERAVAVKVDEVIGSGGLVQPDDYVDVLLYLRASGKELPKTSALIVLQHVRVLAYGDAIAGVGDKPAGNADTRAPKERSAVLAVPIEQTSALMLAASAGSLRLAVYGAQESQAVLAGARHIAPAAGPVTLSELAQQERREITRAAAPSVRVFHGSRTELVEAQ